MNARLLLLLAVCCAVVAGCSGPGGSDAEAGDGGAGCGAEGQDCDTSPECPAGQVCVDHACACALDRRYEVTIFSALVYDRAAGGRCWDDDPPSCADLPDVDVRVLIGDVTEFRTGLCESPSLDGASVLATWPTASFEAFVADQTVPQVWIYDVDGDSSELMGEYSLEALFHLPSLDVETLRQGGLTIPVPSSNPDVPHEVLFAFRPL